jgi:co-chaperonin GroES (HSP10)
MPLQNPFDQTRKFQFSNRIKKISPLGNTVIVTDMNFKERFTKSGIVILGDDGKASGIRPRWGRVYAVGPTQHDVKVGDWICVTHGRWSRGSSIETDEGNFIIRKVDPNDILLSSSEAPISDETISSAIGGNPV